MSRSTNATNIITVTVAYTLNRQYHRHTICPTCRTRWPSTEMGEQCYHSSRRNNTSGSKRGVRRRLCRCHAQPGWISGDGGQNQGGTATIQTGRDSIKIYWLQRRIDQREGGATEIESSRKCIAVICLMRMIPMYVLYNMYAAHVNLQCRFMTVVIRFQCELEQGHGLHWWHWNMLIPHALSCLFSLITAHWYHSSCLRNCYVSGLFRSRRILQPTPTHHHHHHHANNEDANHHHRYTPQTSMIPQPPSSTSPVYIRI